jgi:DNA (cytosine-5)-methyltransferase 1
LYALCFHASMKRLSKQLNASTADRPTAIDLFSGAGGLSTGLCMAGFDVLYANEIREAHSRTLAVSHPGTHVEVRDIRHINPGDVMRMLSLKAGDLDLVAGGPPCQGFSINAPTRSIEDERNHLFLSFLRFVEVMRPRCVLIENVPGMVSFEGGQVIDSILGALEGLGYAAAVRVLFAAHYGVPQMRWRTIFIGMRDGVESLSAYPAPTHMIHGRANFRSVYKGGSLVVSRSDLELLAKQPATTVDEAISDLPPVPNGGGAIQASYASAPKSDFQKILRGHRKRLFNHLCAGLGPANLERLPYIPPGGSWRDIPHHLLPAGMKRARRSDHTKRYGRLDPKSICSTILTKCDPHWGAYIHPSQDRVLTVREAARIQSFPDRVVFQGGIAEQYEQVGNAVPPLFAMALGRSIIAALRGGSKGLTKAAVRNGFAPVVAQRELWST